MSMDMTRPPLTVALRSVLAASVDGAGRPGLLTFLHAPAPVEDGDTTGRHLSALADVLPLPRVIPMPRRAAHHLTPEPDPDPSAA
jgi:hypothetical protein